MPKTRIPSPARSQSGMITPRRNKPRGSRSVCSPALSTASGRLTSVIDQFREKNLDAFALSPLNSKSVLTDNTDIEEPRRKSWWKNLNENSRDVLELLEDDKVIEANNAIEDIVDIEVLSQEEKNYTLDLPESSDNESINSIVLPQRRLFTQKENQPQRKFGQLVGTRETLAKLHKSGNNTQGDKTIAAGTRDLFQGTKRTKPIFPAALLNISPNKTAADKTKENIAAEPKLPVRNIFGNRPANKRKNMFVDFIVSESEDEISEIQPKVFGFQKNVEQRHISTIFKGRESSPTSSMNTDIELDDDWIHLPSSTMVENQLDEMVAGHTPVKRARLSKLAEVKESAMDTATSRSASSKSPTVKNTTLASNKTVDKTKQSNTSITSKNKTRTSPRNKDTTKSDEQEKTRKSIMTESKEEPIIQENDDDENNFTLEYENDDEIEQEHDDNNAQTKSQANKLSNKTTIVSNDESKAENKDKVTISPNKTAGNRSLRSNTLNKSHNDDNNKSLNRSRLNKSLKSDDSAPDKRATNTSQSNKSSNKTNRSVNKSNKSLNKSEKSTNKNNKSLNKSNELLNKSNLNNSLQQQTQSSKVTKMIEESQDSEQHTAQDNIDGVSQNKETGISHHSEIEANEEQEMGVEAQKSHESEAESDVEQDEPIESQVEETEDIEENEQADENEDKHVSEVEEEETQENNKVHDEQDVECREVTAEQSEEVNEDHSQDMEEDTTSKNDVINEIQEENKENNTSQKVNKESNENKEEKINKSQVKATLIEEVKSDQKQAVRDSERQIGIRKDDSQQQVNQSKEGNDELNQTHKEEGDDEGNQNQEVEDNQEGSESKVAEEDNEVNQSQEVVDDQDGNESEEVEVDDDVAVDQSQEIEDDEEADQSQDVEDDGEVDQSQEVEDDVELDQSHEIEDDVEVDKSQEVEDDDEGIENQEAEDDDVNQSQEVEDEAEQSEDEEENIGNQSIGQTNNISQEQERQESEDEADASQEIENEEDEPNENQEVEDENQSEEDQEMDDSADSDRAIATDEISEDDQEEMEVDDDQNDNEVEADNAETEEAIEESPNVTHDTTGRHRKKVKSPEVLLHDKTNQRDSFIPRGRNTSVRKTKSLSKDINIRPSLAPARDSLGLSDGTRDSSAEGSGWDSHRTTRKTLRKTFGKDFTPRKSLRTLVIEKSAKQAQHVETLHSETVRFPQANSTEYPDDTHRTENVTIESDHEVSRRTRQTTLETYLQKIKQQNIEKKMKMEEAIRNSLKAPATRDTLSLFKVPARPPPRKLKPASNKPKKQIKSILFGELPSEVVEDMKYKPPKRYQPANASWITKRLYKYLENKLEPKYDYKARVRAEKLVETIYQFARELRRHDVAPCAAVDVLKLELARLDVVKTHFDFYEFFQEFMPREVRVKVVPDIVNKIPLPRHGVFADILRGNTVHG